MAATAPEVPMEMIKVYRRLERWRSKSTGRRLIPASLWASAAGVARQHGVNRTAQALRLEYNKLKQKVESTGRVARRRGIKPTFVELLPAQATSVSEATIELEGPRGRVRILWKGNVPDLAGLVRELLNQP
jgi:hypothetical protein